MTDENKKESTETGLTFPCKFPIKAMGKSADDFDAVVVGVIREHVDDLKEGAVTTKTSKGGKYTSVTVEVDAKSKEQLDAIYQSLNDHPDVDMTL